MISKGDVFGHKRLTEIVYRDGGSKSYRAQCILCGQTSCANLHALKNRPCRCQTPRGRKHYKYKGVGDLSSHFFASIRCNATTRGLTFDVSHEFLWCLFLEQQALCALTGLPIRLSPGRQRGSASLDRIRPHDGYTTDNVQWVHKAVNIMKQAFSNDEFVEWCWRVTSHTQRPRVHIDDNYVLTTRQGRQRTS